MAEDSGRNGPVTPIVVEGRKHKPVTFVPTPVQRRPDPPGSAPTSSGSPGKTTPDSEQSIREATVTAAEGPIPLVYGTQRVGGRIFYVNAAYGYLFVALAFCEGPVSSITAANISIDGVSLTTCIANGWITQADVKDGAYAQTASSILSANFAYTQTHPGLAYVVLQIAGAAPWSQLPAVLATINGLLVYDPTDLTTKFSANPVLIARDMMVRVGKLSVTKDADFDDTVSTLPAIVYYDDTTYTGAAGEKRYALNLAIISEGDLRSWLANIQGHCGLNIYPDQGVYVFAPDKVLSSPVALTDAHLKDVVISRKHTDDVPTRLMVHFTNVSKDYIDDTAVAETAETAAGTEDVVEGERACPGLTTMTMAQRHALYLLRRENFSNLVIQATLSPMAEQLRRGDYVTITTRATPYGAQSPVYRLNAQGAIVTDIQPAGNGEFAASFEEYDASAYSTAAYTTDTPPSTDVPGYLGITPEVVGWLTNVQSPAGVYWNPPRIFGTSVTASVNGSYYQIDLGAGVTDYMVRYITNSGTGGGISGQPEWSDNGSAWTAAPSPFAPIWIYRNDQTGVERHVKDWPKTAAPHRYWRIQTATPGVFCPWKLDVDPSIDYYELHNQPNQTLFPTETAALIAVIPAESIPTAATPFDMTPFLQTLGGIVASMGPVVVAVRKGGFKSRGVSPGGISNCTGGRYVSAQGASPSVEAGVNSNIGGTQKAGVTESPVVLIDEGSAPSAVSGKTVLFADSTGHRLRVSRNGGAFDDVLEWGDASVGAAANKLVLRDSNGDSTVRYSFADYFNCTADDKGNAPAYRLLGKTSSDNYGRWYVPPPSLYKGANNWVGAGSNNLGGVSDFFTYGVYLISGTLTFPASRGIAGTSLRVQARVTCDYETGYPDVGGTGTYTQFEFKIGSTSLILCKWLYSQGFSVQRYYDLDIWAHWYSATSVFVTGVVRYIPTLDASGGTVPTLASGTTIYEKVFYNTATVSSGLTGTMVLNFGAPTGNYLWWGGLSGSVDIYP